MVYFIHLCFSFHLLMTVFLQIATQSVVRFLVHKLKLNSIRKKTRRYVRMKNIDLFQTLKKLMLPIFQLHVYYVFAKLDPC